jgi:two-component system NarL family sensor kinase
MPTAAWRAVHAARAAAVVSVTAAVVAFVVVTGDRGWDRPAAAQIVVDGAVGISYPVIAVAVLTARDLARGSRLLVGALLVAGLCSGLTALCTAGAVVADSASAPVSFLVQTQAWLWVPGFLPLLTLVPLLYPDGLLPGRVWRLAAVASCAGIVLFSTGVALFPETFSGQVRLERPLTAPGVARVLVLLGALLLVPSAVMALAGLAVRLRSPDRLRSRQVVVLIAAAGVLAVVTALQGALPSPLNALLQALAVVLLPVAIGVAITRHGLYELDTVVRRALVAGSLALCLAGWYLTLFSIVRIVVPGSSVVASALAAGLTGVVVQPLARRLTDGVDRLFYGDRADPFRVSTRLSSRLAETGPDVAEVPRVVCETVVESLRLGGAEVWLAVGGDGRRAAHAGAPLAHGQRFELRHHGQHVGWVMAGPRAGEPLLEARDVELLAVIADQVAPAIAALRLYEQLQLSRQSLVSAREQERLRLRRELHDGLGATLAGVRLQVESAQAVVRDSSAARLLEAASGGVAHAVAEVRTLTDNLRPPALDELGLVRALELLAERHATPGLNVAADIGPLTSIEPAVEVAAYRIAAEALTNAGRHSAARQVVLDVTADETRLTVRVLDDGRGGVVEVAGAGLGLASMRTRAEEIGGQLTVGPGEGGRGAEVRALLPLQVRVSP